MVAIRVISGRMQALRRDNDISHGAVELEERKCPITKSKATNEEILRPKISGLLIARVFFDCYQCLHLDFMT